MLELLIGRSGSGKTEEIWERISTLAQKGKQPLVLLVPEQHSFENERRLVATLPPHLTPQVLLLDFSRLAQLVLQEVGGFVGNPLDDATRCLIMSRSLEQALRQEGGDTGSALLTDADYISRLLGLYDELSRCAVSLEQLEELEQKGKSSPGFPASLVEKTARIRQIFTVFEGLMAECTEDTAPPLTRLAEALPHSALLKNATVFVDGFKGFTAQQLAVLDRLLPQAEQITVALTADTAGKILAPHGERQREMPLFSPVTETANQLWNLAQKRHIPATVTYREDNKRAKSPALQVLERELYAPKPACYEESTEDVRVIPCADPHEECAQAVREIRRLIRQENYRCREITVVMRQPSLYRGLLQGALEEAGIPCFTDERRDIFSEPLVAYLRCALRLAVGGWDTETVLRLLKTDLTPLNPVEIATLENYVFCWQLDRKAWEMPFTDNPAGLDATVTPESARLLAQLNTWREQIMAPLLTLRQSLRGAVTGREFALALYTFLITDPAMPERIAGHVTGLEEMGEKELARHNARIWDEIIKMLDRFATALGETRLSPARLEDLFKMQIELLDLGHLPQGLDAVTVGNANRIRYSSPRAVVILGANEGVFPAYVQEQGFLNETERTLWREEGIPLQGDALERSIEERYYAYTALAAPSEKLILTYETSTPPSPLVKMIDTVLPRHAVGQKGELPETGEEMFSRLAQDFTADNPLNTGLYRVLSGEAWYKGRLEAVERSAVHAPFSLEDAHLRDSLYAGERTLSATQTDTFFRCRFQYFCKYSLGIAPPKKAQIDNLLFGTIVHFILETRIPQYNEPGGLISQVRERYAVLSSLSDEKKEAEENALQSWLTEQIRHDVAKSIRNYTQEKMGKTAFSGKFAYQLELVRRGAENMLWHTVMDLQQNDFSPIGYEIAILPEQDGTPGAVSFRLPFSKGTLGLKGKVDRADVYVRFDGASFIRVVDYKSGAKVFSLNECTYGLNMQMLLYLFVLCDNASRLLHREEATLRPAGVLYQPLSTALVDRTAENKTTARIKTMSMNGLVLEDADVILAMDKTGEKLFVPAGLDKNRQPKGETVTPALFGVIRQAIEKLLIDMAEILLQGDIAAIPRVKSNASSPCDYCDYRDVCCHEDDDPVEEIASSSTAEVLRNLEEAGEEAKTHE